MKVVLISNRAQGRVLHRLGLRSPERYGARTLDAVADALREGGHDVVECEGDAGLLDELARLLPPDRHAVSDILAFNMAYGIQGESRYTHVPAMLELAGVPYTGSSPFGHALALDKVVTKDLLVAAGIPTPAYRCATGPDADLSGLRFPLVIKPRHESTSNGLHFVRNAADAAEAIAETVATYEQAALVEEYVDGREVSIGLLGNDPVEALPIVELDFAGRDERLVTRSDKFHRSADEPVRVCPAPLRPDVAERLRAIAVATFRACHIRDYARVDIRLDHSGEPYVLEINSMASLGRGGSFVQAGAAAGHAFPDLVNKIVDVARLRVLDQLAAARTGLSALTATG
jgi:D-alanine-D-alanine ligase